MIEIKSLYKSFEGRTVLNDINFTFHNGKTNLIIGQSGSGKTVLMKCLVGLLTPEKGEVLYDGRNLITCLLYTSPSPRDLSTSRMPSSA